MKKIYSLFLVTAITMASFGQVLTSSIVQDYDGLNLENSSQTEYEYYPNNNLFEEIYTSWDATSSLWDKIGKAIYYYNTNNKVTEFILQSWDESIDDYDNLYRYTYAYNSNGDVKETIDYTWDGADWINDSDSDKSVITYNGNKLDYVTTYSYNVAGSEWVIDLESTLTTYTYNANILIELEQKWKGADWIDKNKNIYTYNANGQLIEDVSQEWIDPNWVETERTTYDFVNGNMTTETEYSYNNGWVSDYKTVNTFDPVLLMSNFIHPFNDKTGKDYLFGSSNIYYNKILTSNDSYYFGDTWEDSSRTTFYYDGATAGLSDIDLNKISVYPNPTADFVFITENANIATFKILDLVGKTIVQDKLNQSNKIDVSNLKEGLYILELKTSEGITTYKKVYKK